MTDFELQRRLRDLREGREPTRDLWPAIAERIAATERDVVTPRRRWIPLAAAAGIAVALIAGFATIALRHQMADQRTLAAEIGQLIGFGDMRSPLNRSGGDPRLAGAHIVLDAAHTELQQALEQEPQAVFLVGLLNRTNEQRMKLARFGENAG